MAFKELINEKIKEICGEKWEWTGEIRYNPPMDPKADQTSVVLPIRKNEARKDT